MRLVLESRPDYKNATNVLTAIQGKIEQAKPLTDVFLWCHTWPTNPSSGGRPSASRIEFGLKRGRDLCYTPEHQLKAALGPDDMPMLYRHWDGVLYQRGGEGFGLPAWEPMCSGISWLFMSIVKLPPSSEKG